MVINVESSHCYGNFELFVSQVQKVLKPDGIFAYTDFRTPEQYEEVKKVFERTGWIVEKEEDITVNVI